MRALFIVVALILLSILFLGCAERPQQNEPTPAPVQDRDDDDILSDPLNPLNPLSPMNPASPFKLSPLKLMSIDDAADSICGRYHTRTRTAKFFGRGVC